MTKSSFWLDDEKHSKFGKACNSSICTVQNKEMIGVITSLGDNVELLLGGTKESSVYQKQTGELSESGKTEVEKP